MSDDLDIPDYMVAAHKARRLIARGFTYDFLTWPMIEVVGFASCRPFFQFLHAEAAADTWRYVMREGAAFDAALAQSRRRRRRGGCDLTRRATFYIQDPHIAFEFKMKFV